RFFMAQPAQVFAGTPSNEYSVIDNGLAAAEVAGVFNPPLYAEPVSGSDSQGKNAFTNGTIPDAANPSVLTTGIPQIQQKTNNSSTGSVASLAKAFASNNSAGNSILVVCGVGNGTAPTISDTAGNSYSSVVQIANGSAFNVAIFLAKNIAAG